MKDLFEQYETLPQEVKNIIDVFNEKETTYPVCEDLINALEEVGYTCEYDLEGVPFNLSVLNSFSGENKELKLRFYEFDFKNKELYGEFLISKTKNTNTLMLLSLNSETKQVNKQTLIKEFFDKDDFLDSTLKKKLSKKDLEVYKNYMFQQFTDFSKSYSGN
jgi:hypothetical protein